MKEASYGSLVVRPLAVSLQARASCHQGALARNTFEFVQARLEYVLTFLKRLAFIL
jgi:hypothetical protein